MFSRRMMSLSLPVLVLSLVGFMPGTAKAWYTPKQCRDSLVNVNINVSNIGNVYVDDINILNYNVVDIHNFLNDNEIKVLNDLISHDVIASFNQVELEDIFEEVNILNRNENEFILAIFNGCCYVCKR